MMISFVPSPDVTCVLNALLDIFERRATQNAQRPTEHATRSIKVILTDLPLPSYFSQTDPTPHLLANEQLTQLEQAKLLKLTWLPGETGHLLQAISLQTEYIIPERSRVDATRNISSRSMAEWTNYKDLYALLNREPVSSTRSRLETLLLADQFRIPKDDWRAYALRHTLSQLRAGKSPTPFSLTDSAWNLDLLTILAAIPQLATETPYRVFSVRTFNDSKRFDDLKPALARLARRANSEWKTLSVEDLLRELNLVANPGYIHLAGNWQLTTLTGEILSLGGFTPSMGFPASQVEAIQSIHVHADAVLCIENLTSYHEFLRSQVTTQRNTKYATLCLMGNPSPSIRRLLKLVPETIPIYLWSDLDYGGFNILSQLRKQIRPEIQPFLMDIPTFERYLHLSRPLSVADKHNLQHLCARPELNDIQPIIKHIIQRGLKLEQEAIEI